jgi:hypothetical protein
MPDAQETRSADTRARWTRTRGFAVTCVALGLLFVSAQGLEGQGARDRGYLLREPPASVTLTLGATRPAAGGDLFRFTFEQLTLNAAHFTAVDVGGELARPLSRWAEGVVSIGFSRGTAPSEFRAYVDQDDLPIEQSTTFARMPIGGALRFNLMPRGRPVGSRAWIPARVVPWVEGGGGLLRYRFAQTGDFVDAETLDIFSDSFSVTGWSPYVMGGGGVTWTVTPNIGLRADVRYLRASARPRGDFIGFDRLDLSGVSGGMGLVFRF